MLERIRESFNDVTILQLTAQEKSEYYAETRKAIDAVNETTGQVFLIANGSPAFNALLAAKLILFKRFMLGEWIGNRFKILRVP